MKPRNSKKQKCIQFWLTHCTFTQSYCLNLIISQLFLTIVANYNGKFQCMDLLNDNRPSQNKIIHKHSMWLWKNTLQCSVLSLLVTDLVVFMLYCSFSILVYLFPNVRFNTLYNNHFSNCSWQTKNVPARKSCEVLGTMKGCTDLKF